MIDDKAARLRFKKVLLATLDSYGMASSHTLKKYPDMRMCKRADLEPGFIIHHYSLFEPVNETVAHALQNNGVQCEIIRGGFFQKRSPKAIDHIIIPLDQPACPQSRRTHEQRSDQAIPMPGLRSGLGHELR